MWSSIIEAFSALKSELQKEQQFPDLKLIIIGDDLVGSHPRLRRTVVRSGVQNDVRFLGFVPIEVLRIFYDVAKIFVFPFPLRGIWIAAAGSDGPRNSGSHFEYLEPPGSGGERGFTG